MRERQRQRQQGKEIPNLQMLQAAHYISLIGLTLQMHLYIFLPKQYTVK
jgi:hypothetical protein